MDRDTLAEQEFAHVAAQLSTEELTELDRRAVEGEIDGLHFVNFGCGCLYGSIGQIRGVLSFNTTVRDGINFRNLVLGEKLDTYMLPDDNITFLEGEILYIRAGDTPADCGLSAWLHSLLSAEIARRQEVR